MMKKTFINKCSKENKKICIYKLKRQAHSKKLALKNNLVKII